MRKLVVSEFISLDGVIEDPGGGEDYERGGWAFMTERGPEGDRFKLDELLAADALLLGRVTYEGFAAAWPRMTGEDGFAERMNGIAKYVVSSTLERAEWNNSSVLSGDLAAEVAELKRQPGSDILVAGSARLVSALIEHDLIDEYRLMVYPLLLGDGKRLFADGSQAAPLRLREATTADSGVMMLVYEPARSTAPLASAA
jgi:dihydrofolate reductase